MDMTKFIDRRMALEFKKQVPDIIKDHIGAGMSKQQHAPYSVAGNTFRAFGGYKTPPSRVYREWASRITTKFEKAPVRFDKHFTAQDSFDDWHHSLSLSLQRHWRKKQGKDLLFAHQVKLIDLFIKWLSRQDYITKPMRHGFIRYANCALDGQTLESMNKAFSNMLPMDTYSMGLIKNEHAYRFCQSLIRTFTSPHDASPLIFDYYVWKKGGGK